MIEMIFYGFAMGCVAFGMFCFGAAIINCIYEIIMFLATGKTRTERVRDEIKARHANAPKVIIID